MMKTFFIALSTLLFIMAQVSGFGNCKVNAQTAVKTLKKDELKTVKIKITGMTCAGCSNHVSKTVEALKGVIEQNVKYPGDVVTIKYNPAEISVAAIIKAIENIGYKAIAVSKKNTAKQG